MLKLASADPLAPPRIFPNYFAEPEDMRTMVRGIQRLREIPRTKSLRGMISREISPSPDLVDDAAIEADVRKTVGAGHHPMSTCRMGSDPRSVVDPMLRVRGVEGLRVVDASIMPSALCAGPHGPVIMIAEKAAGMIRASA